MTVMSEENKVLKHERNKNDKTKKQTNLFKIEMSFILHIVVI